MILDRLFLKIFKDKPLRGTLKLDYKDGYRFGSGPAVNLKVKDKRFFKKVMLHGDTGFGEAYFMGYFETDDLYNLLKWFIVNKDQLPVGSPDTRIDWARIIGRIDHLLNKNTKKGSRRNIHSHYDLSNRFYSLWLDETMTYSCGVFEGDMTLKEAQENKYRKICEKLKLSIDDKVLEIGTGWGGFAEYVERNYGMSITTITISEKQFDYATNRVRSDVLLQDYRDITGNYDKIVSIEMMEALGHEYVPVFIKRCSELLNPGGRMVHQIITIPDSHFRQYLKNPGFIKKHIFPGGELLSLGQIKDELKRNKLKLDSVEEIGDSYVRTLLAWRENFLTSRSDVLKLGFDEAFIRKWDYYLTSCAVGFDTEYIGDVQFSAVRL